MLSVEPLRPDQYRQVAEWEFGPQENADWDRYAAEMNAPQWTHFSIYVDGSFIGCVSLEKIDPQMTAFHVVTARRAVSSRNLAQVLLKKAGELFARGHTALVTRIPKEKRAAAILALRCGMCEWGHTPELRYFVLTKSRFLKNGQL